MVLGAKKTREKNEMEKNNHHHPHKFKQPTTKRDVLLGRGHKKPYFQDHQNVIIM